MCSPVPSPPLVWIFLQKNEEREGKVGAVLEGTSEVHHPWNYSMDGDWRLLG